MVLRNVHNLPLKQSKYFPHLNLVSFKLYFDGVVFEHLNWILNDRQQTLLDLALFLDLQLELSGFIYLLLVLDQHNFALFIFKEVFLYRYFEDIPVGRFQYNRAIY